MSVHSFRDLLSHVGHNLEVVVYGKDDDRNVAIECLDCREILVHYDYEQVDVEWIPVKEGLPIVGIPVVAVVQSVYGNKRDLMILKRIDDKDKTVLGKCHDGWCINDGDELPDTMIVVCWRGQDIPAL